MRRLIHLNGPPGIGKSTLARRYVAEHPGVLNCDIDTLRTLIGGWESNFEEAGALVRPAALAMIEAYLANGHDVVLPQMLINPTELARFEACATGVGAVFVERFVMDTPAGAVARFHGRGAAETEDPGTTRCGRSWRRTAGTTCCTAATRHWNAFSSSGPTLSVIVSADGALDETYRAFTNSLR